MKYNTQNLNESKGEVIGSMFWRGRAWFRRSNTYDEMFRVEWYFGKYARDFAATISFGHGYSESGIMFHLCIPWIFSFYLTFPHLCHCEHECKTGVAIHNGAIWFYPLTDSMESRSDFPWWRKCYAWYFPWTWDWCLTEVLNDRHEPVWLERVGHRLGDPFTKMDDREKAAAAVTDIYDYEYQLKRGEVQQRKAAVHIVRMTWRMRWWWILPFKMVRTSIDVRFNEEVGEKTGSWKGGCIGCGYDMLPDETKLMTLRRMEMERKFV